MKNVLEYLEYNAAVNFIVQLIKLMRLTYEKCT